MLSGLFVAITGLIRTVFTDLTGTGSDAAIAVSTLAVVTILTPVKNQLQALVDSHFKQQHDPQKALKELVAEGRLIARVLDRERFIESVLEAITAAFGLAGASVEIAASDGRQLKSFGHTGEGSAIDVPLVYRERLEGRLTVWLPDTLELPADHLTESLEGPADALARIISLVPEGPVWHSEREAELVWPNIECSSKAVRQPTSARRGRLDLHRVEAYEDAAPAGTDSRP